MSTKSASEAVFKPKGRAPSVRQKRSDQVAEEIKRWTVHEGLVPGNRLPKEKELADWFGCGRGTVREALKALEVQGFVLIRTGPNGGAVLMAPGYRKAAAQLRAYFNYQKLDIEQVYDVRLLIEPEMAASVVDVIDDAGMKALKEATLPCEVSAPDTDNGAGVRDHELDFHAILARLCPNPLLAFQSLFISNLLRDYIAFDNPGKKNFDAFTRDNCRYHRDILDAMADRDRDRVRDLMREHMVSARRHSMALLGKQPASLLFNP